TGSILSGTIAGDGSLVLSVFYTADEPEPPFIPVEPPVPPAQSPQPQAQIQPQAQTTPAPESEEAIAGLPTPTTSGNQPGDGTSSINDIDTPMSSGDAQGWSLLNLLLTLLIAALMVALLGTYLSGRKDGGAANTRHIAFTAVGVVATAVAAIVFFITSDLSMPMQVMDSNTARFALIAVMQAALAVLARRKAPATE
ncbi:MAG: hypothetical protein LBK04_02420, partial [Clostridiales Family XIII bacterium]|nr:hypothetical protein [Clostridiales Family XIII bacterium]